MRTIRREGDRLSRSLRPARLAGVAAESPRQGVPVRVLRARPMARVRLCCFPFAGGGVSAYAGWAGLLPDWIELWAASLPARESRALEPLPSTFGELARGVARALEAVSGPSLVLFGHSMGAVLAYEVARSLVAQGSAEPGTLVVSGRGPPWAHEETAPPPSLSDEEFARLVQNRYGGIPPQLFSMPQLFASAVAVLRADIALVLGHRASPTPRLSCPILALGGRGDVAVRPQDLAAWKEATGGRFSVRMFPGGHFYMQPDARDLVQTLVNVCLAVDDPSRAPTDGGLPGRASGLGTRR